MGHKTKGIGGVVLCSSCCDGEKKGKKITLSRNWKVIPSELSQLRAMHISLHKNVILEEHSYQQTVLTWTICLDIEVGIADRQDPMGLCSSLHPPVYFIFCISDSAMRQGSDHGNRRWGKKGLRRPVFNDTAQLPLHRKHAVFFYIHRNMYVPKNIDLCKKALPKLLSSQLTNGKIRMLAEACTWYVSWLWVEPTVAHCSGRLSSPETHKSANPKISLTEPGNPPAKISFLSSDHIFLTPGFEQHLYSVVYKEYSQTHWKSCRGLSNKTVLLQSRWETLEIQINSM